MAISQRDRIILWARAGGRCSIADCRRELTQNAEASDAAFTLGQMAHIVGEKEGAARGHSALTGDQRDLYTNLVLLCPLHHRIVDEDPAAFPIERLHLIKDDHEQWVREALGGDDRTAVAKEIYAGLIDAAVAAFEFEQWDSWTHLAFDAIPSWDEGRMDRIHTFRRRVLRTPWPGTLPELERAFATLSIAAEMAVNTFMQHSEPDPRISGHLRAVRWYRSSYGLPDDERVRIEKAWEKWDGDRDHLVKELCRAANWWSDVVRRDINPRFLVNRGRFTLSFLNETLGASSILLEYGDESKKQLPDGFVAEAPLASDDD